MKVNNNINIGKKDLWIFKCDGFIIFGMISKFVIRGRGKVLCCSSGYVISIC